MQCVKLPIPIFCFPIFIYAIHCAATSTMKWHVCTNDFHRVSTCMLLHKDKLVVLTTEYLGCIEAGETVVIKSFLFFCYAWKTIIDKQG